jgi:OmpR family response regulator RpaB
MEYALLILLADEPGRAFSRDEILSQLKGTDNELFSRSVDILVSRLRAKLKPVKPIRTIHGAGYAFIARVKTDV